MKSFFKKPNKLYLKRLNYFWFIKILIAEFSVTGVYFHMK